LGWARQFGLSTESLMSLPYWQHWHSGKRYVNVIAGIAILQSGSLVWTYLGGQSHNPWLMDLILGRGNAGPLWLSYISACISLVF
jgi:hypothetical protein